MNQFSFKISPAAKKVFRKTKDKQLQTKFRNALEEIQLDPFIVGEQKKGDLAGIFGYDISHNGTNYEIAYTVQQDTE